MAIHVVLKECRRGPHSLSLSFPSLCPLPISPLCLCFWRIFSIKTGEWPPSKITPLYIWLSSSRSITYTLCTMHSLACDLFGHQKTALQRVFSPSPQRRWTSDILSADLQMPLQLQSKEATQRLPACAFHSQSDNHFVKSPAYRSMEIFSVLVWIKNLPGGVPQHNLRSSICSTSNPMNQAPKETSSFAYLCSTCLNSKKFHSKLDPKWTEILACIIQIAINTFAKCMQKFTYWFMDI